VNVLGQGLGNKALGLIVFLPVHEVAAVRIALKDRRQHDCDADAVGEAFDEVLGEEMGPRGEASGRSSLL
jgi:hypothetical protein